MRKRICYPQPAIFNLNLCYNYLSGLGRVFGNPLEEEAPGTPQPAILIYLNLCYNKIAGWEDLSE